MLNRSVALPVAAAVAVLFATTAHAISVIGGQVDAKMTTVMDDCPPPIVLFDSDSDIRPVGSSTVTSNAAVSVDQGGCASDGTAQMKFDPVSFELAFETEMFISSAIGQPTIGSISDALIEFESEFDGTATIEIETEFALSNEGFTQVFGTVTDVETNENVLAFKIQDSGDFVLPFEIAAGRTYRFFTQTNFTEHAVGFDGEADFELRMTGPAVPEPTGAAVFLLGLGVVAAAKRKRRNG